MLPESYDVRTSMTCVVSIPICRLKVYLGIGKLGVCHQCDLPDIRPWHRLLTVNQLLLYWYAIFPVTYFKT